MNDSTCVADDCFRQASAGTAYCHGHLKRRTLGKTIAGPLAERPKEPWEVVAAAAIRYANADEEDEFQLARDNFRKAVANYNKKAGMSMEEFKQRVAEATRRALAELKARGIRLGPPRKVEPEVAVRMVSEVGLREAASRLHVSLKTVRRAIRVSESRDINPR